MISAPDIASDDSSTIPEKSPVPAPVKNIRKSGGIVIDRPGQHEKSWERWYCSTEHPPEILPPEAALPPQAEHLVALPSSTLFAWPLWVASDGVSLDLALLELSGRHLLKRGMEESLRILPILRQGDRQLVLAVAPEEPFPGGLMTNDWKKALRFELPARLLAGSLTHDLILWEEWGRHYLAFYRNQQPVWWCAAQPHDLGGLIHRIALRLLAEGVLEHLPSTILLNGLSEEMSMVTTATLAKRFPQAQFTRHPSSLPPQQREDEFDLPPDEARQQRSKVHQQLKLYSFAIVGVILYLLLLLWGAGDLFIRENALKHLRRELSKIEQPALDAQRQSSRWHALRPVIDPNTYALDLLAAVATPTEGGKVRFTLFSLEQGHLHLSGEAMDVTQAYSVIEQLKKNPLLQEYEWTSSQPQLAGKNSVKFDMEGIRPDASKTPDTQ